MEQGLFQNLPSMAQTYFLLHWVIEDHQQDYFNVKDPTVHAFFLSSLVQSPYKIVSSEPAMPASFVME